MTRKSLDLALVGGLALAALALALAGVDAPLLRLLLGLPLVLLLPGYALTAALFPDRELDKPARLLLTLCLSVMATILGGFALNLLPWGIATDSWAVLLCYITLGGCLVAFARRRLRLGFADPDPEVEEPGAAGPRHGLSIGQIVLFGIALTIIVGAILIAREGATRRPSAAVIQLWMLPDKPSAPDGLRVGLISVGPAEGTFQLQVLRGGYLLREWPEILITAGQRWEGSVPIRRPLAGSGPVEARLYRREEPGTIYRRVTLWLEGEP